MWFDIIILAILIYFTLRGAAKGMVWQLAGIAGIVLCFVFADAISAFAGPYVALEPPLNNWIVLFGAYVVFTFISYLIAGQITEYLAKVKLKEFDRHLGAVFGFVKGVILSLIITFLAVTMSEDMRAALKESRSGVAAAKIVKTVHPYLPILPEKLVEALEQYIHLLDDGELEEHYANKHNHPPNSDFNSGNTSLGESQNLESQNRDVIAQLTRLVSDQTKTILLSAIQQESDPQAQSTLLERVVGDLQKAPPIQRAQVEQYFQIMGQRGSQILLTELKKNLGVKSTSNEVVPSPAINEPPITNSAAVRNEIDALRKQIVSAYTTDAKNRLEFEKQIEGYLGTLPEAVYLGVLKDWNADIWSLPDPDQTTNGQSTLEERILRQIANAGISIQQLPLEIQQRLRAATAPSSGAMR